MHYHCEIVMPPTDDVEKAVTEILAPFDESGEDTYKAFWDYWKIGGRYSGDKVLAYIPEEELTRFYEELNRRNITVSAVIAGKQTLQPAGQIPLVDELWRDWFPETGLTQCPLFDHFKGDVDIMKLNQVNPNTRCFRIIFAGPSYSDKNKFEAKEMYEQDYFNGCSLMKTEWDGTFSHAFRMLNETANNRSESWREKFMPKDNWLVVTVDYHS